jgi:hypothetical protein
MHGAHSHPHHPWHHIWWIIMDEEMAEIDRWIESL